MLFNEEMVSQAGLAIGTIGIIAFVLLLPQASLLGSADLTAAKMGSSVRLSGKILDAQIRNGNAFLKIENAGVADVFYYGPAQSQLEILRKNAQVEITGTIGTYRGKKEIIAQKVRNIGK